MRFICFSILLAAVAAAASPTLAAEGEAPEAESEPEFTFEAEIGVISNYVDRGVSLSGGNPALQATATVGHSSGLYAAGWASTIEEYGIGADGDGAVVELNLTLGWAGSLGGFDLDVGVSPTVYPGGDGVDLVEFPLTISRTFGAWTVSAGVIYAPRQSGVGDEDNTYAWAGVDWAPEEGPWSAYVWFGHEDGAWAPNGKTDWAVGVRRTLFDRFIVGLHYYDANVNWTDPVLAVDLRMSF